MSRSVAKQPFKRIARHHASECTHHADLPEDYFRVRDFEYVQPLYDLSFLLEIDALSKEQDVPKYRTFSLWRAGLSLDGYGTTIDRWMDGAIDDVDLDYVPSSRISDYLRKVRKTGTVPELRPYQSERFARCLRLRAIRGLGPRQIASTLSKRSLSAEWLEKTAANLSLNHERLSQACQGMNGGFWQTAHVVPPLLRFLNTLESKHGREMRWAVSGIKTPFEPIRGDVSVASKASWESITSAVDKVLRREKHFRRDPVKNGDGLRIKHRMGWRFDLLPQPGTRRAGIRICDLAQTLDPLARSSQSTLKSDLHLHTAWSDGTASVDTMAKAIVQSGLEYFAVTDHSRSSKLQGGLTPVLWLRQANALTLASPVCPVLHGIEVDILKDGTLDLPHSLLRAADLVIASVHSSWTDDVQANTRRLIRAIESGCIDIIAHPTSAIIGKPGVPDFVRDPADVAWDAVFQKCAQWRVALELNCFPSRLDLPMDLLAKAIRAGCAISMGSDAHARSHLLNLRFGEAALAELNAPVVLNRFSYDELKNWLAESSAKRRNLAPSQTFLSQPEFQFGSEAQTGRRTLDAHVQPPQTIPRGSRIVGIDLTAGNKLTGVALLDGFAVETSSLSTDQEILAYVQAKKPKIVSIDSPLGLPGGGDKIDPKAGIVRVAEQDLASIGIPAYPALIDSMEQLTLRGIRLRKAIEQFAQPPRVIESYPGAAQDILSIPRKQKSLDLLREGLRRLGLTGVGLDTRSDDEMDAITSAIVGRYFESGLFEPMGIPSEAQLIVPKVRPLRFSDDPVICLAGKTAAGKSVVARYLSVFYGFEWVRTRNVIRDLLIEDLAKESTNRLFKREGITASSITEKELQEFGAVILNEHHQIPLRKKLTKTVRNLQIPIVVDAVRDAVDIDQRTFNRRPVITWYVDCADSIIQTRLSDTRKSGKERIRTPSPVDRTATIIREEAAAIIPNSGSLEDLRWHVDDALFEALSIHY